MPAFSPSSGNLRDMSPSLEQYVEAIADLLTRGKVCSVSEIAQQVKVSRPAASRAVRELAEQNIVEHKAYSYVDLTPKGQAIARKLATRHVVLHEFLRDVLQFDDAAADTEACRLEHQVEDDFTRRLGELTAFFAGNEDARAKWQKRIKRSLKD